MYLDDVPRLSAKEVTTLSHGYTAPLPLVHGFAMKQLDRVGTSFPGDQKQLHLLFVTLVRISSESPGPIHRATQGRLVRDDGIFLTSYTLVVVYNNGDQRLTQITVRSREANNIVGWANQ